jgi:membrane protein
MGLRYLWLAGRLWLRADCVDLSAAFAYHSLQSFFPALLIALAWLSRILGNDQILRSRVELVMQEWLPQPTLQAFVEALDRFSRQGLGAGLLGAFFLILSAGNIYLTLQRGADRLWWNRPYDNPAHPWVALVKRYVRLRLKAFLVLLVIGLVVVIDQFATTIRVFGSTALKQGLLTMLPPSVGWLGSISVVANLSTSLISGFLAAWLMLWFLPSRRIPVLPLIPGACLVAVGLTGLNLLLGRALVLLGFRFQAYGVVGGVMLVFLWIWLIGALLYYAQCFSVITARRRGYRLQVGDPHCQLDSSTATLGSGWMKDGP